MQSSNGSADASGRAPLIRKGIDDRLALTSVLCGQVVHGLVMLGAWPDRRRVALLLAIHLTRVGSISLIAAIARKRGLAQQSVHRNVFLLVASIAIVTGLASASIAQWSGPAILSILFAVMWMTANLEDSGRHCGRVQALTAGILMWRDGVPHMTIAAVLVASIVLPLLMERRAGVLTEVIAIAEQRGEQLLAAQRRMERLHAQAIEREKLSSLGVLAAGIAHEINNPMSYVTSNLDELRLELQAHRAELPPSLAAAVEELLPDAIDGVARVNTIVGDLRRYARGEEEREVELDVNEQIRAALRICHSALRQQVTATCDLGELPLLSGRPNQIAQIFINLVVNAAEAIPGEGNVRIRTRFEEGRVEILVEDDGRGMSEETAKRIFDPFFTTKTSGTGLGMAVVQGIVRGHGGHIEITSTEGVGTAIRIQLPQRASYVMLAA